MTRPAGIVLFGPPAAGKDTVTEELSALDPMVRIFRKLKEGTGRSGGYRPASAEDVALLHARGQVVSEVARYGNRYIVDLPELERMAANGLVPVVHTAEPTELATFGRLGWTGVLLWCNRGETVRRLERRCPTDTEDRLAVWDSLARSLRPLIRHLRAVVRTDLLTPREAAVAVLDASLGEHLATANLGSLSALEPVAAAGILVAVPTLRDHDGRVDWDANEMYAAAAATGDAVVLVGGSTGRGDEQAAADRSRLQHLWLDALGEDRVVCCLWGGEDVVAAFDDGRAGVGLASLVSASAATWKMAACRPGLVAYSHPRLGWRLTSDLAAQREGAAAIPAGAKLSKYTLAGVAVVRWAFGAPFAIWHGSARDPASSLAAGANAVVAAAAAPLACEQLPRAGLLYAAIDDIQRRLDTQVGRPQRLQLLEELVRERLLARS